MTPDGPTHRVVEVVGDEGLGQARSLFRAYAAEFAGSIAEILCHQGFEAEVAGLPGRGAAIGRGGHPTGRGARLQPDGPG